MMMRVFVLSLVLFSCVLAQVEEETAARAVRWCVPYDQPPAFARLCTKALSVADTDDVAFECVVGGSFGRCFEMIRDGEAELTTADGGDAYLAHTAYNIEPLLYENYGEGIGTEYYAVAVVNEDFCSGDASLEVLRGVDSCHTGYRKTAGWFMPLGTLLDASLVTPVRELNSVEDDAETLESFFGNMCAPRTSGNGPVNGVNGEGEKWEALCVSCGGDCTTHDKYYDYQGAFRCLMEGAGDVAFVKHSTVPDFAADGQEAESWATKEKNAFMLLCRDGSCKDIEDHEDCHWAQVPAHSVVADSSLTFDGPDFEFGQLIQEALVTAVETNPDFLPSVTELAEQENFLFKSGTVMLTPVRDTYENTVGGGAQAAYKAVTQMFGGE